MLTRIYQQSSCNTSSARSRGQAAWAQRISHAAALSACALGGCAARRITPLPDVVDGLPEAKTVTLSGLSIQTVTNQINYLNWGGVVVMICALICVLLASFGMNGIVRKTALVLTGCAITAWLAAGALATLGLPLYYATGVAIFAALIVGVVMASKKIRDWIRGHEPNR